MGKNNDCKRKHGTSAAKDRMDLVESALEYSIEKYGVISLVQTCKSRHDLKAQTHAYTIPAHCSSAGSNFLLTKTCTIKRLD